MEFLGVSIPLPKTRRDWRAGGLLFVAYLAATRLSLLLFSAPAIIFPAAGIALGALFLEGLSLWPFVFLAALAGQMLNGAPLANMIVLPLAHTLQAALGAWLLQSLKVDPIFRRTRDMFSVMLVSFIAAAIVPTIGFLVLGPLGFNTISPGVTWESWYTGMLFSLILVAPFVMRWFSKIRFTRTLLQTLELAAAFALLLIIAVTLFWYGISNLFSISMVYFLLIPLFWISLRMRPRFVTLALLVTAIVALAGIYLGPNAASPEMLGTRLLQVEIFLIMLAVIFYILVSLEEERRMATTLLMTQVTNLRGALEQLSSQNRAKSEFIAMLAHELRNPLAPVVSTLDLLRTNASLDAEHRGALDLMDDRMKTIRRLLDDLLDVSRITEQKLVLKKELIPLSVLINRAIVSTKHHFDERDQHLHVEQPHSELMVDVDPVRIEQVITNLLTNASKFSYPRDTIRFSVRYVEGMAEIVVSDTGVGVEPEMQKRIFEPFLQVELGQRTRQGLGIGLALVRNLVELHGGTVRVSSEGKEKGTTFTVMLPVAQVLETRPDAYNKDEAPLSPDTEYRRVLVVDDNDAAAWSIGKLIELQGCSVDYAYSGEQAMRKTETFVPDIILLDIGLPDRSGHDVARELRLNGYQGTLVAISGYGQEEERERAIEAGFDHYLVKPVGLAELRRTLGC